MFSSRKIKLIRQMDSTDCGTACLSMITRHFGTRYSLEYLNELCQKSIQGVDFSSLSNAAKQVGLSTNAIRIAVDDFSEETLPCIVHWNNNHFVVLYKVQKVGRQKHYFIADPAFKKYKVTKNEFEKHFLKQEEDFGYAMLFCKSENFEEQRTEQGKYRISKNAAKYIVTNKIKFLQLIGVMLLTSMITLLVPYVTQLIVDKAIKFKDVHLLFLLFFAQIGLFIGDSILTFIRTWITTYLSGKIGLALINDFLVKLFKLPMRFFDSKSYGDLAQRIQDHKRLEEFLTSDLVSTLFSITNVCIYSFVVWMYGISIFFIFILSVIFGIVWMYFFQTPRKKIEYLQFQKHVESQNKLHEIVGGIQEVKLFEVENQQQQSWFKTQQESHLLTLKRTKIDMYQSLGYSFFQHGKNILITFLAAKLVMSNQLSFGGLLSLSFVLGQTNQPLNQLLAFAHAYQDAKLSMHRLWSIQALKEEPETLSNRMFTPGNIQFKNFNFRYFGQINPSIQELNLCIEKGKTTAIVGESGSGKTTLLRLILGYYPEYEGEVHFGKHTLSTISPKELRANISTVMQNGYIFDHTFLYNITMEEDYIDQIRFQNAIKIANLSEFLEHNLRGNLQTKIGKNGMQLSGGQCQRILIARAVYKKAAYFIFDEATSALDTENEALIMQNIYEHFRQQTVILVAHRLSTIKNADTIVVLDKGQLVEQGTHLELLTKKGKYYSLVKNQLS